MLVYGAFRQRVCAAHPAAGHCLTFQLIPLDHEDLLQTIGAPTQPKHRRRLFGGLLFQNELTNHLTADLGSQVFPVGSPCGGLRQ